MWYFAQNNQQHGPVSEEELKFKIRSGILVGSSLVWKEGMSDWKPASAVTEFSMLVGSPISSSERLGSSNETPPFSDPYSPPQNSPVPSFSPPMQTGPMINGGGILAFGIMVTMLCCMPFGIAGIVYAAQINSKQSVGGLSRGTGISENCHDVELDRLRHRLSHVCSGTVIRPGFMRVDVVLPLRCCVRWHRHGVAKPLCYARSWL